MTKYFYKETGMYIDWKQLKNLPDIDTFIDVGVGAEGTPDLYEKFCEKKLVLIDPLDEAEKFYKENEDLGGLIIKEYATRTASVATLRNHIEKLKLICFRIAC